LGDFLNALPELGSWEEPYKMCDKNIGGRIIISVWRIDLLAAAVVRIGVLAVTDILIAVGIQTAFKSGQI